MNKKKAIKKFQVALKDPVSAANFSLVYRISGGAPNVRLLKDVKVDKEGNLQIELSDKLNKIEYRGVTQLPLEQKSALFLLFNDCLELPIFDPADFVPDALVGAFILEINGELTKLFFDATTLEKKSEKNIRPLISLNNEIDTIINNQMTLNK